jgi:hypothetical protein
VAWNEKKKAAIRFVNVGARVWVQGCANRKKRRAHAHAGAQTIDGGRNGDGDAETCARIGRGMDG